MNASLSDTKRYLSLYLLFCLAFIALTTLLILLFGRLFSRTALTFTPQANVQENTPIVIIDAGHGGEDGGTVGVNGINEKDLNLQIAKILNDMLQASGVQTVMTRTEDVLLYDRNSDHQGQKKIQDLATRRSIAEKYPNAVFVSIHMNSFPQSKYCGLQVYYSPNNPASQRLASSIQENVKQLLSPNNNRVIKPSGGKIYLLDRLQCPSVLVECGFLSNPEECALLSSEKYQQQMAFSICHALLSYLSNSSVKSPSPS